MIYEERTVPEIEYTFRHAFTQEAVYEEIPEQARKEYHKLVAADIESLYADRLDEWCETLAYHYSRSDVFSRALEYLIKAGRRAMQRSAVDSAIAFLEQGLEFIELIDDEEERNGVELEYRIVLGGALALSSGYAAPEIAKTYGRARDLCRKVKSTPHHFEALHGLASYYLVKAQYDSAYELGVEQKRFAENLGASAYHLEAHLAMGLCEYYRGRFEAARKHIEKTLSLYNKEEHIGLAHLYGHDPAMAGMVQHSLGLWIEGFPERARSMCDECMEHCHSLNHPPSVAFAGSLACITYQCIGEYEKGLDVAEESVQVSVKYDLALFKLLASIFRVWYRTAESKSEEELEEFRNLIDVYSTLGLGLLGTYYFYLFADRMGSVVSPQEGLKWLDKALSLAEKNDKRLFEAELHRFQGELLRRKGVEESSEAACDLEAEASYLRALDVAREQGARSLELRAAMSLGRLRRDQGNSAEALGLVEGAFGKMTEGFETKDLIEAKALIESFS